MTVSAADNAGIGRVEIVDVTNPAAPRVVGAENYDVGVSYQAGEQRTDRGATCSFRLVKPCPNLSRETVRPRGRGCGVVLMTDPVRRGTCLMPMHCLQPPPHRAWPVYAVMRTASHL